MVWGGETIDGAPGSPCHLGNVAGIQGPLPQSRCAVDTLTGPFRWVDPLRKPMNRLFLACRPEVNILQPCIHE